MQSNYSNKQGVNLGPVESQTIFNLRQDIMGEFEAINTYYMHINQTSNEKMKAVWQKIKAEEQIHVGELMNMLFLLDPVSYEQFEKGIMESNEILGITD